MYRKGTITGAGLFIMEHDHDIEHPGANKLIPSRRIIPLFPHDQFFHPHMNF